MCDESTTALQLCIHVGVHGYTDVIQIESCGHNVGYNKPDVNGQFHETGCCVSGNTSLPKS